MAPRTITTKVHAHLHAVGMMPADEAPYLLQVLGVAAEGDPLARLSPQAIRARTFATLQQVCLASSRRQALILAVENLHWIDPTSEEWLTALVERLAGAAILVLVTYRPGYRPAWLAQSYATQLALPRLTADDSLVLVQSVPQSEHLPDRLRQAIVGKAAGNPFFLEELARAVGEHGSPPATLRIPDTIQAVLAARIDRLPPLAKRLLQAAAVIGLQVSVPLLQAITEVPEDTLAGSLRHVQAAEFLYETAWSPSRNTPSRTPSPRRWPTAVSCRSGGAPSTRRSSTPSNGVTPTACSSRSNGSPTMPSGASGGTRPSPTIGRPATKPWRARPTAR